MSPAVLMPRIGTLLHGRARVWDGVVPEATVIASKASPVGQVMRFGSLDQNISHNLVLLSRGGQTSVRQDCQQPSAESAWWNGELFRVESEGGQHIVSHPNWSLVGCGRTLKDAMTDLESETRDMVEHYVGEPDEALSESARELRDFLDRLP